MSWDESLVPAASITTARQASGVMALATMSDDEFAWRLEAMRKGQQRLDLIHRTLMKPDVDYGNLPGTNKPTLMKAGAEKLANAYGLVPSFEWDTRYGDGDLAPHITVLMTCRLHPGDTTGPVVGTGVGACNSWEKKYRWRSAEPACPECGGVGTITRSKRDGGWFCWARKGGCGAEFPADEPEIRRQQTGQVANPDPYELLNTIVKMAKKRAYVDAVLQTTATSGLYTQDLEELDLGAAVETPGNPEEPAGNNPTPPRNTSAASRNNAAARGNGRPASSASNSGKLLCGYPGCGKVLTKGQHDISVRTFGKPLCPACQKVAARAGGEIPATEPSDTPAPASSVWTPSSDTPAPTTEAADTPASSWQFASRRMFGSYTAACKEAGIEYSDEQMRLHCGRALSLALGQHVTIHSRRELTLEQIQICTDYFERNGVPDLPEADPGRTDEYEQPLDDPFQDE